MLATLEEWTRLLQLPLLSELGVAAGDFPRILAHSRGSSMKTNPIPLHDAEIERILHLRLLAA